MRTLPAAITALALCSCASNEPERSVSGVGAGAASARVLGTSSATASPPDDPAVRGAVAIRAQGQVTLGNVRIGAGNFREEDYTDATGKSQKGWTALAWVFVRGEDPAGIKYRVYPGYTFDAGPTHFVVSNVRDKQIDVTYAPR